MSLIISYLVSIVSKYWPYILLTTVIVGFATYVWYEHHEVTVLTAQTTLDKQTISQASKANQTLLDQITQNNKVIADWQVKSVKATADMSKLQQSLQTAQQMQVNTITKIITATPPATCTESIQYLIDGVKDIK